MNNLALPEDEDAAERRRLGDRLKEARKYLGLRQEEVATYLKIPRTALTDIESGQRRVEAIELSRLARLYRQTVAFFTGKMWHQRVYRLTSSILHAKLPIFRSKIVTSSVDLLNIYVLALELRGRSDGLNYASAVRAGTMAGARLHQQLDLRSQIQDHGGNVDVFGAIHSIDLPLLLRPLQGLLGAYINDPGPGVLVTTQRPMSIQRFTAAHG